MAVYSPCEALAAPVQMSAVDVIQYSATSHEPRFTPLLLVSPLRMLYATCVEESELDVEADAAATVADSEDAEVSDP
ncbi:uncharacterized protein IUM83_06110 [Phytophthora cinnamomi]|uniref:uncharacterized protein n=1 Tax=Phytophthora cinnamomi TaxID=4785 RepID=UPI0035595D10|nr:hypothetical protein IUM83_06110 [Phytophthora cinnamomi]